MLRLIASTILTFVVFAPAYGADSTPGEESSPAAMTRPARYHVLDHLLHDNSKHPVGLPSKWDKRIPLPDGVSVTSIKPPSGAAQAVEFNAPGNFDQTIAFYREALPKAGFELGPEVKVPERRVYNLNFTRAKVQDTLTIFPAKTDPSKLAMRIIYTPEKGWVRTKLAKWEDRIRIIPKWWRHHEEEKHSQASMPTANRSCVVD